MRIYSLLNVDYSRYKLPIIVVYKKPLDYPNHYVARLFDSDKPTDIHMIRKNLDPLRRQIPKQFVNVKRDPRDENHIVESYV